MLTCFIVDDEPGAVDILCTFIEKTPFLALAGSATDPVEALSFLRRSPVDLLFLDIHMPQISGLDVLRLIGDDAHVVLTTASAAFAIEGFALNAVDYLLKPIAYERFLQAAQKALPGARAPLARAQSDRQAADYVFVQTEGKGKMARIDFAEIVYVEGMKNYVSIHTLNERIISLLNLKDLESRLPSHQFLRVHKSYIICLDKIRAVDGNQIFLRGTKAVTPLGDTYRTAFYEALQEHIMGGPK